MPEAELQRCETSDLATVERSLEQSIDLCVFHKLLVSLVFLSVCCIFRCLVARLITLQILHYKSDLHYAVFSNYVAAITLVKVNLPRIVQHTRVGPKVSGLTFKSLAKWKMLRGIYSSMYGEVTVSVSVCVEIKGDYIEK